MSLVAACAILIASCAADSADTTALPVVRDSAGVTIVENSAPQSVGDAAWRLGTSPTLTIGGSTANPDEELYRVRGAIRLDDGRIVVANAGTSEIRFYDETGALLHSVGSEGGGPGEFQTLSALRRYGADSLAVLDGRQRRITLFDLGGNLGRMTTLISSGGGSLPFLGATFGVFEDKTFFLATIDPFSSGQQTGATRGSEPTFHVSATGVLLDTLGAFPGREIYIAVNPGSVQATSRIFGTSSHYAVGTDRFYVGTNDRYEIARYTSIGSLETLVRTNRDLIPVEGHHRDAFLENRTADMSQQDRIAYVQRYDGNEPPSTFPAFDAMIVDRDGYLWVSHYLPPDESDQQFSVFNGDGHWITEVDLPDDISILEIGADYVLALWQNELDVEHIRLFDLDRM